MPEDSKFFFEFGPFRLDPEERLLRQNGQVIPLSPKIFDTLLLLVQSEGRLLTKDYLIEALWSDSFVEEGSLTQNISLLRKTLGDEGGDERQPFIKTLPKRGYRFVAEVKKVFVEDFNEPLQGSDKNLPAPVSGEAENPQAFSSAEKFPAQPSEAKNLRDLRPFESAVVISPEAQRSGAARWTRSGRLIAVSLTVLALASVAGFFLISRRWERASTTADVKSIAVLPFQNIGGEPDEQYLGIGLADALITKLGNLKSVVVRPTSAVRKYVDANTNPLDIGRELGVEAVIEGSVQRSENRLRVTVQMVRVSDGISLWAEKFDTEFTTLLAVEDSISEQVARRLTKELSKEEQNQLTKRATANPEAHQLYLQGRYSWNQRTSKSLRRAIELFEESIRLDPEYALAYEGMASCYVLLGESEFSEIAPTEAFPKARTAAQKALELDEKLAEAHAVIGIVQMTYEWDLEAAAKSFRQALELNPNDPTAVQWYAWYFIAIKRFDEAEQMMQRARELDPVSLIILTDSGYPAFFAKDYDAAVKHFSRALEFDENYPRAHFGLWRAFQQKGDYEKALAEIERAQKGIGESALMMTARGITLASSGKSQEARKVLEALVARKRAGEYVPPLLLAALNAELGSADEAFVLLNEAFAERNDILYLRLMPEFKRLHRDPRFVALIRRVGMEL